MHPKDDLPAAYIALLKGVNVGGKNKLQMKELGELFVAAGCTQVRTYIQSGNVVFAAIPPIAAQLQGLIMASLADRFGMRTAVVLRTPEQLRQILRYRPFPAVASAPEKVHVLFLSDVPDQRRAAALDGDRFLPDRFVLHGQEIYIDFPNGAGTSKLTYTYFEKILAVTGTARNWRTVTKLLALADEISGLEQ